MLRTIGRMIWVAISFVIATAAALLVLVTLGMERVTQASAGASDGGLDVWLGYFDQIQGAWAILSMVSIVPAVLAVIVGEVARIRTAAYWVPAGGAALAAVPFLARFSDGAGLALPPAALLQVLATAGFAAGLAYWALAGRSA
jgi:hypothetical protein